MKNKIIVSLIIAIVQHYVMGMEQQKVCKQMVVYRPVDPQNEAHNIINTPNFFLPIAEQASLQTLGQLKSTCRLLHDWIGFDKNNLDFNATRLGSLLTTDFDKATNALISCAHANNRDLFVSIFNHCNATEQKIRIESLKAIRENLFQGISNYTNDVMNGYKGLWRFGGLDISDKFSLKLHLALHYYINNIQYYCIGNIKSPNSQTLLTNTYQEIIQNISEKAIINNNYIAIQILQAARLVDVKDPWIIWKAVKSGSLDIIRVLLEKSADINRKYQGITPLMLACLDNKIEIARYLLQHGAHINDFCDTSYDCVRFDNHNYWSAYLYKDYTALDIACKQHNKHMVELLLQNGACIDGFAGHNIPLCIAFKYNDNDIIDSLNTLDTIEYLLKAGANIDIQNTIGRTPLMFVCIEKFNKTVLLVNSLLEKGANCLINDQDGNTALHIACAAGSTDCVEMLLLHNKDLIDVQNDEGKTPLHYAQKEEIVQLLLEYGANVNIQDANGNTPLHNAQKNTIVTLLLEYGADLNSKNNQGTTPLLTHVTSANEKQPASLIINHPLCNINAIDAHGNNALHLAINKDFSHLINLNLIKALLDKKCHTNAQNISGETPLHYAAKMRESTTINLLLSYQADPTIRDYNGDIPAEKVPQYDRWWSPANKNPYNLLYAAYKRYMLSRWLPRVFAFSIASAIIYHCYK